MNSVINDSTPRNYCINKAIPEGSNLYYATLFEEDKNKNIIIGLHAFLNELTEIIHECSDPGIARIKLHWWQEEIARLFNYQARHPVTRQLHGHITLDHHLKAILETIVGNFDKFVFIDQPESFKEMLSLYASTTGEVWYQCGVQLKVSAPALLQQYRNLGSAYQFIQCLQDPNTYITESRCIIPRNIIKHDELLNLRLDVQNSSTSETDVFSPLIKELKITLEENYSDLCKLDSSALKQGLILNRLALKTCDEILNDGCRLLSTHISLTPLRKLWIAWWTNFIS